MPNALTPLTVWLGRQDVTMRHSGQVVRLDRALTRVSRGRMPLLRLAGLGELTLIVPGRKSGIVRTTPLLTRPWRGGWIVVGSNWGHPRPPAWVANLRAAAPGAASIRVEGREVAVTARELAGAERDDAWAAARGQWPNYDLYALRTTRVIPVFQLVEHAGGPDGPVAGKPPADPVG